VGFHQAYIAETDPARLLVWGKYLTAISTFYFTQLNLPKLAICALYYRLFPGRTSRIVVWVIAGVLIAATVSMTIALLAACEPFEANWNPALLAMGQARCINKEQLFIWTSIPSIVTDTAILVFPMPLIWKLHTNTRMKVALTFTFFVGSL
jgi:hypothetical protein